MPREFSRRTFLKYMAGAAALAVAPPAIAAETPVAETLGGTYGTFYGAPHAGVDISAGETLLVGGRGFGKTHAMMRIAEKHALENPGSRTLILEPTDIVARRLADHWFAKDSGVFAAAGIRYAPTKRRLEWPNGSSLFVSSHPERFRGPTGSLVMWDNVDVSERLWSWDDMEAADFNLRAAAREGKEQRIVYSTTGPFTMPKYMHRSQERGELDRRHLYPPHEHRERLEEMQRYLLRKEAA